MSQFELSSSFSKGELSPLMHGRLDLSLYKRGLEYTENWIITPQGSLTRRPGTRFVTEAKVQDKQVRLLTFEYSTEEIYVLELGHLYMRFYRQQGQIQDNDVPVEIVTPWKETELFELHFTQSENDLYIAHKNHAPSRLTRNSHTDWVLEEITFTGKPSEWVADNYPQRVAFFEERLVWAATPKEPQTIWLSKTTKFEEMTVGTLADSALKLTIRSGQVNAISWLAEDKHLQIGTTGATRTLSGPGGNTPLEPEKVNQTRHTTDGSAPIQPIQAGPVTLFTDISTRRVRRFEYSFENDRFISPDESLFSDHLLKPGIKSMAFSRDPWPICWFVLKNGELIGFTFDTHQKINAWHRHHIAGGLAEERANVESITVSRGEDYDELWMVIRRKINGEDKRYIEFLSQPFDGDLMDKKDACFVDSAILYDGDMTSTLSGADHLEGETLSLNTDGAIHPDVAVSNGQFSLQQGRSAETIIAGLPYRSAARTLRAPVKSADGAMLGQNINVTQVVVDLYQSMNLKAGPDPDHLENVVERLAGDPMDSSPPLTNGARTLIVEATWQQDGRLWFIQEDPMPVTIRAISPLIRTEP